MADPVPRFDPLTDAHRETVRAGCAKCQVAEEYLDNLDKTGIDTTEWRNKLAGMSHFLNSVRRIWVEPET